MDPEGYPDEVELETIKCWPITLKVEPKYKEYHDLMYYIAHRWRYADGYWKRHGNTYSISTGGWSGNEDMIGALHQNHLFWSLFWYSSDRGGHHVFCPPGGE